MEPIVVQRKTKETSVTVRFNGYGSGAISVATGIGFLDHLVTTLAFHAGFDLDLRCTGDLEIDDHHTAEDCALVFGEALQVFWRQQKGFARFGNAYAPLDEALARAVVDLSGRPAAEINLELSRNAIGALACENISHWVNSFATAAGITVHLDVLRGENDHHKAEAAFKALALALRAALTPREGPDVASTKGVL